MAERHIEWTSPAALWDAAGAAATDVEQRRAFRTPAILRFASDSFMQDFVDLVQVDPHGLRDYLAVPETWREPAADGPRLSAKKGLQGRLERARSAALRRLEARNAPAAQALLVPRKAEPPLKLFHPAHQRYYLVAACLVCRTVGLPDRPIDPAVQERVTFVIRRLDLPDDFNDVNPDPADFDELALVDGRWVPAPARETLLEREQQHALSPLVYVETDGRRRRLFNGFIPVGLRETLMGPKSPPRPDSIPDPRVQLLEDQVIGPWAALDSTARAFVDQWSGTPYETSGSLEKAAVALNHQMEATTFYLLLDLALWIESNLDDLWRAIESQTDPGTAAYEALARYNLVGPLRAVHALKTELETNDTRYPDGGPWPNVADVRPLAAVSVVIEQPAFVPVITAVVRAGVAADVEQALAAALPPAPSRIPPRAAAIAGATPFESPWFTIRCVFERPNCAALSPPVVSDPTAAFQFASFFDADAPARPIRVALPADTTPAGLRKFDKNTAFIMSDVLCGQMNGLDKLTFGDLVRAVLPWPFYKDLSLTPGAMAPCPGGKICSFSIPIITICALVLLMTMVKLLDTLFFWLPFFRVCMPLPRFSAKGRT